MKLIINEDIKAIVSDFNVTAYHIIFKDNYNALTKSSNVDNLINKLTIDCQTKYNYDEITKIPKLKETRDGYKAFGKDPSHTRPASEALLRRVVKGTTLYRLGDVIDLGNILSVMTLRSVCVVDYNKLVGDVVIKMGTKDDIYYGIGRGLINVADIPIYVDDLGPFGCPTSDNDRTKVTDETKEILIMIINFSNNELAEDENLLINLYKNYTEIKDIEKLGE